MNTLIISLIAFNFFCAGAAFGAFLKAANTCNDKIRLIVIVLALCLFGYLLVIIYLICVGLLGLCDKTDGLLQISFYFNFYLTKKFDNVNNGTLKRMEESCLKDHNKNTLEDRHYRHCLDLVFRKNNYLKTA